MRDSFPFSLILKQSASDLAPLLFWGSAVLAALIFFVLQAVDLSERNREQAEMRTATTGIATATTKIGKATDDVLSTTTNLVYMVRTLPPDQFLKLFETTYLEAQGVVDALEEQNLKEASEGRAPIAREGVDVIIRVVLNGLVTLAQGFDAEADRTVYAANLMLFHARDPLPAEELEARRAAIPCDLGDINPALMSGYLAIERELSTTSELTSPDQDHDLPDIVLPIPRKPAAGFSAEDVAHLLPGATRAFIEVRPEIIPSRKDAEDRLQEGGWSPRSRRRYLDVFDGPASARIQSFIAIPLVDRRTDTVIGVLNIHRNLPGMLAEKEPADHFTRVTMPFQTMLVRLLALRSMSPA